MEIDQNKNKKIENSIGVVDQNQNKRNENSVVEDDQILSTINENSVVEDDQNQNKNYIYSIGNVNVITKELNALKIYDAKYDQLFKTIFGSKNNVKITKKFLEDILNININDEKQIKFLDKEILSSDYIPNQKAPIVDINIEIEKLDTNTTTNNNSNSGNELSKKLS